MNPPSHPKPQLPKHIFLITYVPVAVMTHDWERLSFSGGRVISEKPAKTKPCGEMRREKTKRGEESMA